MSLIAEPGILHGYTRKKPTLTCFEFGTERRQDVVLFIGGLGDGFLTVDYIPFLAHRLADINWGFVQCQIRSSFYGYGIGSLEKDYDDLSACVKYLRSIGKRRVVLFGHSTGTQDCVKYIGRMQDDAADLDIQLTAAILQAPVSDREGQDMPADLRKQYLDQAMHLCRTSAPDELLPREAGRRTGGAPITAYRYWSLQAPNGDDDFFSSDLHGTERERAIWCSMAKAHIPLLVLEGERDQYIPDHVDRAALIQQWAECFRQESSGESQSLGTFEIVQDGDHTLSSTHAQRHMFSLVQAFLESSPKL